MLNEDPGLPVGEAEIAKKMEALLCSKYNIKDFFLLCSNPISEIKSNDVNSVQY